MLNTRVIVLVFLLYFFNISSFAVCSILTYSQNYNDIKYYSVVLPNSVSKGLLSLNEAPTIQDGVIRINTFESNDNVMQLDDNNIVPQSIKYFSGDTYILPKDAADSIKNLSSEIYDKTGISVFIHIIKQIPISNLQHLDISLDSLDMQNKFQIRRAYEQQWIRLLKGKYAVIFLFYNDHSITIKSNVDFLKTQDLLENYAYPYLPAESVESDKYKSGVNEGVLNLYLALSHTIAQHYNVTLHAPKPIEQPSDTTKIIIYMMLSILIVLFILVSNGFFSKSKKDG